MWVESRPQSNSGTAIRRPRRHGGGQRAQAPATVISPISSGGVLTEPPNGTQRGSAPAALHGAEHRDEVAGDRELAQRLGELAAADRAPRGADREDAGDRVDARVQAGDVGDEDARRPPRRAARSKPSSPGATTRFEAETPTAACGSRRGRRCRSTSTPAAPAPCRCRRGRCAGARLDQRGAGAARRPRRRRARWRARRVEAVVVRGAAPRRPTSSPSRSAKGERPRCTASAPSTPPIRPTKLAATVGSRTTGQERDSRLAGADHRRRALGRLAPDRRRVERRRAAGEVEAEAGLGPAARPRRGRMRVGVAARRLVLAGDAGRGGDRDPVGGVGVDGLPRRR